MGAEDKKCTSGGEGEMRVKALEGSRTFRIHRRRRALSEPHVDGYEAFTSTCALGK